MSVVFLLTLAGLGPLGLSSAYAATPTVSAVSATTNEDTAVSVTLLGSDADGDTMTYSIQTNPSHGTVSISGSRATYTPTANWYGVDTFRYKATDSHGNVSTAATGTMTVSAVNDTPVATAQSVSATEDTAKTITLAGTDADGDTLSYSISTAPSHGSATLSRGVVTYTPTANYNGSDSLKFTVIDTRGATSSPATVSISIAAVNDAPTCTNTTLSTPKNTAASVTVSATDPEGSALTYTITTRPTHGSATISSNRITYTPTSGYTGSDSIGFTASDGSLTGTGTVSVTVTNPNTAPVATAGSGSGTEDTNLTMTLNASDAEGDALTYAVARSPGHGTVTISGNRATFTPTANWSGSDSFTWKAYDGTAYSNVVTQTVTIAAVNDAPTANAQTVSTNEDTAASIRLTATDPDGTGTPTFAITRTVSHGTLTLVGTTATYTPSQDWNGTDTFTVTANDGYATGAAATITINVAAVADPPTAYFSAGQTYQANSVSVETPWYDPDSTSGTVTLDSSVSNGRLVTTSGGYRYTPNLGFHGVDKMTWHVTTDGVASSTVTLQFNVHPYTLLSRPDMPQIGLNKIQIGLGATTAGDWTTAPAQFQPDNIFADFSDLGVQIYRQMTRGDLVWSSIELTEGNFTDSDSHNVLQKATIEPTATLFELQYASPTPPWCVAGEPFQKTMGAEAYTYLDHIMADYSTYVSSYEIGNEMYHWVAVSGSGGGSSGASELPDCVPTDGYSAAEQAVFIEEASRYMQDGDPDAIITLASVNTDSEASNTWLEDVITAAGDTDWFDIVSYHSYDNWQRAYNTRDNLGTLMESLGIDDKLVKLTEMGSTSDADYTDRTNYPNSDQTQCADLFRLALIGWGEGDASAIWHTYLPSSSSPTGGDFQGFELEEYDGTYKPGAYALQLMTDNIIPFKQVTNISRGTAYIYKITTTDPATRYVVWGSGTYSTPSGVTEYTSVYPNSDGTYDWTAVSTGTSVTLSDIPILFR